MIILALKSAALLAISWLAARSATRSSAATRHGILVCGLLGVIAVPLLSAVLPHFDPQPATVDASVPEGLLHAPRLEVGPVDSAAAAAPADWQARPKDWSALFTALWALGALAMSVRLAVAHLRIRSIRAQAQLASPEVQAEARAIGATLGMHRSVPVLVSDTLDTPIAAGILRPALVVPAHALDDAHRRHVLLHELAHLERFDPATLLLAEIVRAWQWFDPLAWLVARRLRHESERATDDRVLRTGARATDYASTLLALCRAKRTFVLAAAMGARNELASRIERVLDRQTDRRGARHMAPAVAALAVTALVACVGRDAPSVRSAMAAAVVSDARAQRIVDAEVEAFVAREAPHAVRVVIVDLDGRVVARAGEIERAVVPGSVFKPVVLAAALEEGLDRTQTFDCENGRWTFEGGTLEDASPNGVLDVRSILARSSNVGIAKIAETVQPALLHGWLARLGVGSAPGFLPPPQEWSRMRAALVTSGLGVTVSSLQLARAYATIANGGVRGPERVLSEQTATAMLELLEAAVTDEGATGGPARIDGVRVGGKTGTAQVIDPAGEPIENRWNASFVGVLPIDRPRYVVAIGVEVERTENYHAGALAAPLFARIGGELLASDD